MRLFSKLPALLVLTVPVTLGFPVTNIGTVTPRPVTSKLIHVPVPLKATTTGESGAVSRTDVGKFGLVAVSWRRDPAVQARVHVRTSAAGNWSAWSELTTSDVTPDVSSTEGA